MRSVSVNVESSKLDFCVQLWSKANGGLEMGWDSGRLSGHSTWRFRCHILRNLQLRQLIFSSCNMYMHIHQNFVQPKETLSLSSQQGNWSPLHLAQLSSSIPITIFPSTPFCYLPVTQVHACTRVSVFLLIRLLLSGKWLSC